MKIYNEHTLQQALKDGINIFAGAGFSILAKDKNGLFLPTGNKLAKELQIEFGLSISDLVKQSTILEKTRKDDFYRFLLQRFTVEDVPYEYYALNSINIRNIYTTNIDNLFPKILAKNTDKFLHNQQQYGTSTDPNAINYLPLHGNVDNQILKFIFSSTSLANIYNDANRIWNYLSQSIEMYPTIFIGYSLTDSSTIEALSSKNTFLNAQKNKWIILLESEESEKDYYEALGFSVIISDTYEFLQWITRNRVVITPKASGHNMATLFPKNIVPKNNYSLDVIRPVDEFFQGQPPVWSDILSNHIYKTSYFQKLQNSVYNPLKHTIVIGAPATGKTTIMMQVAYEVSFNGEKLIFDNLTDTKVEYLVKIADGKNTLIFVENFTDSVDAFKILCEYPNIKVVGIDRGHNYGIVSHLFDRKKFEVINVTELTSMDIQGIYNSLPTEIKGKNIQKETNNKYNNDSIFEFVIRNITKPNIKDRYDSVLANLDKDNPNLAEFLVLCAYAHSSRIPLSSEMAYSYFSDECEYEEIFKMREQLGDLLKDFHSNELVDESMDYYYPRSYFIAESIIDCCPKQLLKRVMQNVIIMIAPIQICNYDVFRKYAFDKKNVLKAFTNWQEGRDYYEDVFLYDYENPYVLQQGALYLSAKRHFTEASTWIDRALNMTNNRYFSIRNSHAIILFDANIDLDNKEARPVLERSMSILNACFIDDKRKTFHATRYAMQAVSFYTKYADQTAIGYLKKAKDWLLQEYSENQWNNEVKRLLIEVKAILDNISI